MTGLRDVDESDIETLAGALGLELAAGEATAAADRVNTLAGIYRDLETVPAGPPRTSGSRSGPARPPPPTTPTTRG